MNKKQLYETIMSNVSKEVKKVLNESYNVNNIVDHMYHLLDNYNEDEEDEKIDLDDALADLEWEITQLDNDTFHCVGEFEYDGHMIKFVGDFIRDRESLDLSERRVYSCYVDDNLYTGGSDNVFELLGYVVSDGWGPSIYEFIQVGKVKKSYAEEKAELDWQRELQLEIPKAWMANGNKRINQADIDKMQAYFDKEYEKLKKRHGIL